MEERARSDRQGRCGRAAPVLAVVAWPAAAAEPVDAGSGAIIGNWASTNSAERLVFTPGGQFHSCFAGGLKGNAAIGRWTRQAPGRYVVEFTHTATPDCKAPARPIRKHAASIVGQVTVSQGELALYVSGEFPPDLYRAVGSAGLR